MDDKYELPSSFLCRQGKTHRKPLCQPVAGVQVVHARVGEQGRWQKRRAEWGWGRQGGRHFAFDNLVQFGNACLLQSSAACEIHLNLVPLAYGVFSNTNQVGQNSFSAPALLGATQRLLRCLIKGESTFNNITISSMELSFVGPWCPRAHSPLPLVHLLRRGPIIIHI